MFSIPFCRAQCKTFFGTVHALAAVQAPSKLPVRQSGFFGSENTKETMTTIKTQYNVHQRPCKKKQQRQIIVRYESFKNVDRFPKKYFKTEQSIPLVQHPKQPSTYVRAQPSQRLNRSSGCWLVFLVGGATLLAKAVVAVLSACFT